MFCSNCLAYGHKKARCRATVIKCKKCSFEGHTDTNCEVGRIHCYHCRGDHMAGDNKCPKYQDETEVLKIQKTLGISFQRARQTYNGIHNALHVPSSNRIIKYDIQFSKEHKCTFSPASLEKCLTRILHHKPASIRSTSDTTYTIEVSNSEQGNILKEHKYIGNLPANITENTKNTESSKGIVYITEYNLTDFPTYKEQLIKRLPISDAILAPWRKTQNPRSTAVLITFKSRDAPQYVDIPGELAFTPVYVQKPRPMLCKKCLVIGHTENHCNSKETHCQKCSAIGHREDKCTSNYTKCYHCDDNHRTGHRDCRMYKYECELFTLQLAKRIPRGQAKIIFDKENPNYLTMNYAAAAASSSTIHQTRHPQENSTGNQGETSMMTVLCQATDRQML